MECSKPKFDNSNHIPFSSSLSCNLCSVICTSEITFAQHLRGSRHVKKQQQNNILPQMQAREVDAKESRILTKPDVGVFICSKCNITFQNLGGYQNHKIICKNHNSIAEISNSIQNSKYAAPDVSADKSNDISNLLNFSRCTVNEVPVASCDPNRFHMNNIKHLNKTENTNSAYPWNQPNNVSFLNSQIQTLKCDTCNKSFNSVSQYNQHMESSAHLRAEQKEAMKRCVGTELHQVPVTDPHIKQLLSNMYAYNQRVLLQIESTENKEMKPCMSNSEPLKCFFCKKSLNGVLQFNQHMQSDTHHKTVSKVANLSTYEKEFIRLSSETAVSEQSAHLSAKSTLPSSLHEMKSLFCQKDISSILNKNNDLLNFSKDFSQHGKMKTVNIQDLNLSIIEPDMPISFEKLN